MLDGIIAKQNGVKFLVRTFDDKPICSKAECESWNVFVTKKKFCKNCLIIFPS